MTTSGIYPFTINNVSITEPVEFKIKLPYPDIYAYGILEEMSTKMVALQKAHWEAALKQENQPIIWQSIAALEVTYAEEIWDAAWSFTLYNPTIDYNTGYAQDGELGDPIATYAPEAHTRLYHGIIDVWLYMSSNDYTPGDTARIIFPDYYTQDLLAGGTVKFTNAHHLA